MTDIRWNSVIRIHQQDHVAIAVTDLKAGETLVPDMLAVLPRHDIPRGHKVAFTPIQAGALVIKYGFPIGQATCDIQPGDWVHSHNLKTHLAGVDEYAYEPVAMPLPSLDDDLTFDGFVRDNGDIGIRNEIWIIPTVECVNKTAELLARIMEAELNDDAIDGVYAFPYPYGCSQLGDDYVRTQKILAGLVKHPNAAGVLVVGLGCENNTMEEFRKVLGKGAFPASALSGGPGRGERNRSRSAGITAIERICLSIQAATRADLPFESWPEMRGLRWIFRHHRSHDAGNPVQFVGRYRLGRSQSR